jgi:outer membrane lipoprotein-sorting protein
MIFTGDKAYVQMNGDWQAMPFSAQQQIDMANASKARAQQTPHTCEKLPDQPINGEATSQYLMHTTANGNAIEARLWISNKTGLPLKSEVHLGDGTVMTDDFRYDNVQAPPGVK